MSTIIELKNYGVSEYCLLNRETCQTRFSSKSRIPKFTGFTGLYYKDDNYFFAIYPSKNGPIIFFNGEEYKVNNSLSISLLKNGKNRKFCIQEYNIEINYEESPFIGMDAWSEEIDVDLFFMIATTYKNQDFYETYTTK